MASEAPEIAPETPAELDASPDAALRRLAEHAASIDRIQRETLHTLQLFDARTSAWFTELVDRLVRQPLGANDQESAQRAELLSCLVVLVSAPQTARLIRVGQRALSARIAAAQPPPQLVEQNGHHH